MGLAKAKPRKSPHSRSTCVKRCLGRSYSPNTQIPYPQSQALAVRPAQKNAPICHFFLLRLRFKEAPHGNTLAKEISSEVFIIKYKKYMTHFKKFY